MGMSPRLPYQERRTRNNASSTRSKLRAIETRRHRAFVAEHPNLSQDERDAALAWLDGDIDRALTARAKSILLTHLMAVRKHTTRQCRTLMATGATRPPPGTHP